MKKSQVVVFVGVLVSAGCTANEPSKVQNSGSTSDAGHIADASNLGPKPENVFTHKMIKPSGENQFASLAYECPECSFEQHLAINTPAGWTKGPSQVAVFSSGEMRSTPSFDGVPEAVDFVAEIPGNEYKLIAKNLDARIIEAGSVGLVVEAQVMRDTLLRFSAGRRVHELTNPEGDVFVLFAYEIDPVNPSIPDFEDSEVLGDFTGPKGWSYTSRILDEELLLDTATVATVLAIRGQTDSTWERRAN